MNVIRAEVMGMCFGVRDALKVIDEVDEPDGRDDPRRARPQRGGAVAAWRRGGSRWSARRTRRPSRRRPAVLITAHGVSDRERARLDGGRQAADRHDLPARRPAPTRPRGGSTTTATSSLVIGRRGHVEVRGDRRGPGAFDVVESADEVTDVPGRPARDRLPDDRPARHGGAGPRGDRGAEPRRRGPVRRHRLPPDQGPPALRSSGSRPGRRGGRGRRPELEQHAGSWSPSAATAAAPSLHVQSAADLDADWFRGLRDGRPDGRHLDPRRDDRRGRRGPAAVCPPAVDASDDVQTTGVGRISCGAGDRPGGRVGRGACRG